MTPISVTYSDEKLRILIEEYIAMQKHDCTFKSLCSYVLYRAMEEDRTSTEGLYESNQLAAVDCERISAILRKVINEGRLTCFEEFFVDDTRFTKTKE